jgi:hypothetical protein
MQRHLMALLRNARISLNNLGYRHSGYAEAETAAIARAAIIEMLGRSPRSNETEQWAAWLNQTRANADTLRRALMTTQEFIQRNGALDPLDLHSFRSRLWLRILGSEFGKLAARNGDQWPQALQLCAAALQALETR